MQLKTLRRGQVVRSATEDYAVKSSESSRPEDSGLAHLGSTSNIMLNNDGFPMAVSHEEGTESRRLGQPKKLLDIAKQHENITDESGDVDEKGKEIAARRQLRNEEHNRILEKCKEEKLTRENTEAQGVVVQEREVTTDGISGHDSEAGSKIVDEKISGEDAELSGELEDESDSDDGNVL